MTHMPLKGSPLINVSHWKINTIMNFGKDKAYANYNRIWNFIRFKFMVFIDTNNS